jgi:WD repeat-containing protein 19
LKKIPVLGKHTKQITSLAWHKEDFFVCGSSDKSFSISNAKGDTLIQNSFSVEPALIKIFSINPQSVIISLVNEKGLYFYNYNLSKKFEYPIDAKRGSIVQYEWFGQSDVVIAFSRGCICLLSVESERCHEVMNKYIFQTNIVDLSFSRSNETLCVAGDESFKIFDIYDITNASGITPLDEFRGVVDRIKYSPDGQFITLTSRKYYFSLT